MVIEGHASIATPYKMPNADRNETVPAEGSATNGPRSKNGDHTRSSYQARGGGRGNGQKNYGGKRKRDVGRSDWK